MDTISAPIEPSNEKRVWYYKYKGNVYYIQNGDPNDPESLKMKTESGEWVPAIVYSPVVEYVNTKDPEDKESRINWKVEYIRTLEDFKNKFEPLPDFKD